MIFVSQETLLLSLKQPDKRIPISFVCLDDGDAFIQENLLYKGVNLPKNNGILCFSNAPSDEFFSFSGTADVYVSISIKESVNLPEILPLNDATFNFQAWTRKGNNLISSHLQIVPLYEELFSRTRGLYETDVLKNKTVLITGLGSGGGFEALELAKAGVENFILVDPDRIEVGNVVRHVCGLSDLGRYKTKAIKDRILDKNPFANVETYEVKCDTTEWFPTLRELVRRSDLVFCSTDSRKSRVAVNRACVLENRVCIYGGAFTRAYGGQVLRVIPKQTMCYECFISGLPQEDKEISTEEQAERVSYADRIVAVEPGLSTDIISIAVMSVKLGILELLRGTDTTLSSLYEDLSASAFLWLNRREKGTQYGELASRTSVSDGPRILDWYDLPDYKDPHCPVCGDFIEGQLKLGTISARPSEEEISAFGTDE